MRATRDRYRPGLVAVAPFLAPIFAIGVSFGLLARSTGWPALAAVAMSLVVFSASAQLASVGVLHAGGSAGTAIAAGLLAHLRYLPMAAAIAPWLRGSRLRRALEAQAVVDVSWLLARRGSAFDRDVLIGATAPQYVVWAAGTAVGAYAGNALVDPHRLGLDVVFPAFFVFLLVAELRSRQARPTALLAAALALAAIPLTPPGVPILIASLAALTGRRAAA